MWGPGEGHRHFGRAGGARTVRGGECVEEETQRVSERLGGCSREERLLVRIRRGAG